MGGIWGGEKRARDNMPTKVENEYTLLNERSQQEHENFVKWFNSQGFKMTIIDDGYGTLRIHDRNITILGLFVPRVKSRVGRIDDNYSPEITIYLTLKKYLTYADKLYNIARNYETKYPNGFKIAIRML